VVAQDGNTWVADTYATAVVAAVVDYVVPLAVAAAT
jgi:hypothetical protein